MGNEQCCANNRGDKDTEVIQIEGGGAMKVANNNQLSSAPGFSSDVDDFGNVNKNIDPHGSEEEEQGPEVADLPLDELDTNGDIKDMMSKHGRCQFGQKDYPGKNNEVLTQYKTFDDESKYIGQVDSEGKKQGKGKMIHQDGIYFEGYFDKDVFNGPGNLYIPCGDFFKGVWKEGVIDGQGIYVNKDQIKYEGGWKDNLQHGYGVENWPDGTK